MFKKMDKKYKKLWIEALESGKYRQGYGALKAYDTSAKKSKYCCLGVLCEIANVPSVKDVGDNQTSFDGEYGDLPKKWAKKLGIEPKAQDELIAMNDGNDAYTDNNKSFKQIADWIRKNI